jgi:hypothetical protein
VTVGDERSSLQDVRRSWQDSWRSLQDVWRSWQDARKRDRMRIVMVGCGHCKMCGGRGRTLGGQGRICEVTRYDIWRSRCNA